MRLVYILRGGAWSFGVGSAGIGLRGSIPPEIRDHDYGFRVMEVR